MDQAVWMKRVAASVTMAALTGGIEWMRWGR
jgi:hypothetical protein